MVSNCIQKMGKNFIAFSEFLNFMEKFAVLDRIIGIIA